MSSSRKGELRKLIKHIESHGYTVTVSGSNHYLIFNAQGRMIMTMPQTNSDYRSLLNTRKNMRQCGIPDLPPKNPKPKDQR